MSRSEELPNEEKFLSKTGVSKYALRENGGVTPSTTKEYVFRPEISIRKRYSYPEWVSQNVRLRILLTNYKIRTNCIGYKSHPYLLLTISIF